MDLTSPVRSLAPVLHVEVLTVLAGTRRPLTGREVHRLLGGHRSQSGVARALAHLTRGGLVDVVPAGSSNLHSLNREHVAAGAATALVGLRTALFDRIRDDLAGWEPAPLAAAVFGSAARGDGDEDSDVDLFLVRPASVSADEPAWASNVARLGALIRRWSGNPGSIIDADPAQVRRMTRRGEPVVAEIRRDAVTLLGGDVLAVAAR